MAQYMLVRNTVEDFNTWKTVFDEELQAGAATAAGLTLLNLWRSVDDPNEVHFIFAISDMAKAKAYVEHPASAAAGERARVRDGHITYIEDID